MKNIPEHFTKKKKVVVEMTECQFAWLEFLAYGLHLENPEKIPLKHNKKNDDFGPMVSDMLGRISQILAAGVPRPGSWEGRVVSTATGWDGTFNRGMAAECIKESVEIFGENATVVVEE